MIGTPKGKFIPRQPHDMVKPETWARLNAESYKACLKFFKNVRFLLKKREIPLRRMKTEIFAEFGISIGIDTPQNYMKGRYTAANTRYFAVFALYFGEPILDLLSRDYEAEEAAQ